MEAYGLDTLGGYLNPILDFVRAGFNQVNAAQGLIISIIAVFLMKTWKQLLAFVGVATLIYTLIDLILPMVRGQAPWKLPDVLAIEFWQQLAGSAIGFFIIISLFFAVKSVLFLRKGKG